MKIMKKNIVIIGSGFGGVHAYLSLKDRGFSITLISKSNHFLFRPLIHEVAAGGLNPTHVIQPIREIIDKKDKFIEGTVKKIDLTQKKLRVDNLWFEYDYLILATGAVTNFYNTKIENSNIFELKDIADASKIRNKIIDNFEEVIKSTDDKKKQELLNFVFIGAGATGVELFTEIHDYVFTTLYEKYSCHIDISNINFYLINKSSKILDRFDNKISSYSTQSLENLSNTNILNDHEIIQINNNSVMLKNLKNDLVLEIKSQNIYWVAGVKPLLPEIEGSIDILPSGRIKVKKSLNLENYPQVFAIGDCAGEYPMLAQIAVRQGDKVAKNIISLINNNSLEEFDYKIQAQLVSLGYKNAVACLYGYFFSGFWAWFIWRTIYLFNFIYWGKRVKIAADWTVGLFSNRDISKV
jgi:NADH dehydrogenase